MQKIASDRGHYTDQAFILKRLLRLAPPLYDARVILFEFINNACAYVNKFTYSYMQTYYESCYYSNFFVHTQFLISGGDDLCYGTGGGSCPSRRNDKGVSWSCMI